MADYEIFELGNVVLQSGGFAPKGPFALKRGVLHQKSAEFFIGNTNTKN